MTIAEASRQYQAQLEAVRTVFNFDYFDDDDRDEALADLAKARDVLEIAHLEHQATLV